MTRLRSREQWCIALLLATVAPLGAQSAKGPLIAPPPIPNAVPQGETFLIRLNDKLDTRKLKPGKRFSAKLAEDLSAPNGSTIARGAQVTGHVSSIQQGLHARLLLSFDDIDTGHGKMPLIATVTAVPGEKAAKESGAEGEIEKAISKRREIESIAVGAGVGAVAGAAAGGGKGAGIGAGAGAGLGALSGYLTDRNITLNKGTVLELRLDHPLQIPR